MKNLSRDEMKKVKGGLAEPPHCVGSGRCDVNTRCCGTCKPTNVGEGNNIYTCQ